MEHPSSTCPTFSSLGFTLCIQTGTYVSSFWTSTAFTVLSFKLSTYMNHQNHTELLVGVCGWLSWEANQGVI